MDAKTLMIAATMQVANLMESLKKYPCNNCGKEYEARCTRNKYIVDENGPYAWIRQDYICSGCAVKREVEEENAKKEAENEREQLIKDGPGKRLANVKWILRSILPPKFAAMEYPMPEFLGKFMPPAMSGVCLYGKSGTGKTTAISMMIREYFLRKAVELKSVDSWDNYRGDGWKFISYPEFIRRLQRSHRDQSEDQESDLLADVMDVPYLVIDDLGAEKPTDYVRQETYSLINHREMYLKPTYITTNFSLDHLDKNIDPRIASRIAGMCHILKMEGNDKRIKKLNE